MYFIFKKCTKENVTIINLVNSNQTGIHVFARFGIVLSLKSISCYSIDSDM